jgi:hypothetical protein
MYDFGNLNKTNYKILACSGFPKAVDMSSFF